MLSFVEIWHRLYFQISIVVFIQRTWKEKLPFILINTLLLHIPLLALTLPQTELRTEERIHLLCMGWRNLFSSCAVVSVFWFWGEIGFGVTYVLRVQYSCGIVLVFCFWWEIVFGVTYVLSGQYSCAVLSVFWLWWEIVLKTRTPFDFLWAVSMKKSYWVTLLWSASWCVYFVRPKTLLLSIFLFCIFLFYHTDPQVEVQIRILLKDKYVKLCQNANTGNYTMISCTQFLRKFLIGCLYFTETTR